MINQIDLIKLTRRFVIFVVGITVLLFGIILIFIPGPAILVIPLALAILGTEFLWARKLMLQLKEKIKEQTNKLNGKNKS